MCESEYELRCVYIAQSLTLLADVEIRSLLGCQLVMMFYYFALHLLESADPGLYFCESISRLYAAA